MKPYYRKKGRYGDGRSRVVIEQDGQATITLEKPEVMRELLQIIRVEQPYLLGRAKKQEKNGQFTQEMIEESGRASACT